MKHASLLALSMIIIVSKCEQRAIAPVPINGTIDVCTVCQMSVSDNGYAAEIVLKNGKAYKFDDIGCLFGYLLENNSLKAEKKYVQDRDTKRWVEIDKAYFVEDRAVHTPMSYGIHAFESRASADKFASIQKQDRLFTATELLSRYPLAGNAK